MRLDYILALLVVFLAAMFFGWTQTRVAAPERAAYERHMSGGADLKANNPFAEAKK